MIVRPHFFKGEIYIPHSRESITGAITDIQANVIDFINRYERECLEMCLGGLSVEFFSKLDAEQPSLIIQNEVDPKWDYLMNGREYLNKSGVKCTWKGIRRRQSELGVQVTHDASYSFLAEYVYFFYERTSFISNTNAGQAKAKAANAQMVTPHFKVVNAWRRFVKGVQGDYEGVSSGYKAGQFGGYWVDYSINANANDVCLYKFISDMNEIDSDNYKDFNPKIWGNINQFTM